MKNTYALVFSPSKVSALHQVKMSLLDIQADAQRVVDVCKGGGVDLIPASIGYALVAVDPNALEKIFMTKQRAASKRHPMMGTYELHKEFHIIEPRNAQIIKTITQDLEIPLAVLAPYRPDHPMVQKWDPDTREASTVDGKVVMMLGTGKLTDEIVRLLQKDNLCFQGSSANATGSGKFIRVWIPSAVDNLGREQL